MIREDKTGIKAKLGIQPPVSVRWVLQVALQKQLHVVNNVLSPWCGIFQMLLPVIETAAVNAHSPKLRTPHTVIRYSSQNEVFCTT